MSYHRKALGFVEPHSPLAPPPGATTERLLTTSTAASGNVNRVTCEGAGGVYTEHCPSMAQVGVVGPWPTAPGVPAFQPPCVAYCEMPDGEQASTQEDPYNRWAPKQPGMMGFGGSPLRALRARRASMYRQNPYYKRTGMISHRHPFHGAFGDATGEAAKMYSAASPTTDAVDVYDLYVGQFDKRYVGVQGFGCAGGCGGFGADSLVDTVGAPALRGAITGLAAYGVASAVGIESGKAKRLAFVMGGLDVAISLLSSYLKNKMPTP